MNVLLISEHYYPKIGGTVSYVENTAINLAKLGVNVYLLVPSVGADNKITPSKHPQNNLTLLNLGVKSGESLLYDANERKTLCQFINNNIIDITQQYQIEVVHILFGLFVAEILNTKALRLKGVKTFHTIHNIPPFECSRSWKGDKTLNYIKDEIRKIGVYFINKKRIKKNEFDIYIADCKLVKNELKKYVNPSKIHTIGLGGAEHISTIPRRLKSSTTINILTAGGIVPHKNQHLIPLISNYLKQEGIDFKWNIVGPNRNQAYVNMIKNKILDLKLTGSLFLNTSVSNEELKTYYTEADLYIQISSEEGFCLTVLDAIAYGIPVLGTPTGAIPEMLEMIEGPIIENNINTLKPIIAHYVKILDSIQTNPTLLNKFKQHYTWSNAAEQLMNLYHER
ncbi:MAG: hypothetical protein COB15_03895 [Flavobacteriales bacterium]|nr:MAG: hypothetical protein COB15_03895 [Flavobacteriales bacterium]